MNKWFSLPLLLGLVSIIGACAPETSETSTKSSDTIRIGAALSETGKFAREGKDARQGYNLWRDWVNEDYGGIKIGDRRYKVEIVYYDDEGNPDTVTRLVEKLIVEDKVNFLLAPYSSGLTKSASVIAEKYDTIIVSGGAAADSLFNRGLQNLFSISPPASNYTQSSLEALSQTGAKTLVIAYEDTPFPTDVGKGTKQWAEKYGMKVLGVETYPRDVADVSAIMSKFKALNPDVFMGGGHFNDALLFARSAKELNFSPKAMILTVAPSNPKFAAEMGADANYIFGPTKWESSMNYKGKYFGSSSEYAELYQAKWGEPATYQAAGSTAGALSLHLGIEKAGSLETDAVRQALRDINVNTFYGPIDFDETGKNIGKPMGTIQILDGQIKVVAPKEAAVAEITYPMPAWKERKK
ncbi:MAG: ABC transporter substrate-binding protein [Prochloraceae cyanobacterium]